VMASENGRPGLASPFPLSSSLAGGFFVAQSRMNAPPHLAGIAGYAGVGALYSSSQAYG
jgi:hypothetical protein